MVTQGLEVIPTGDELHTGRIHRFLEHSAEQMAFLVALDAHGIHRHRNAARFGKGDDVAEEEREVLLAVLDEPAATEEDRINRLQFLALVNHVMPPPTRTQPNRHQTPFDPLRSGLPKPFPPKPHAQALFKELLARLANKGPDFPDQRRAAFAQSLRVFPLANIDGDDLKIHKSNIPGGIPHETRHAFVDDGIAQIGLVHMNQCQFHFRLLYQILVQILLQMKMISIFFNVCPTSESRHCRR